MKDNDVTWHALMVGALLGTLLTSCDRKDTINDLRQQAIERGFAIHDPQTGEWRCIGTSEVAE